ncbi:MAG TPA: hypothetical protein QGF58_26745 [Myxococcota bacterium]|nr:hypothetical protein [Myxococcota bacterium]
MPGEEQSAAEPVVLEPIDIERLGRLRAEWELAAARAQIAQQAFQTDLTATCRRLGVTGTFELDLARGLILPESGDHHVDH